MMAHEHWLFPYDLRLTVRIDDDGEAYLAIHIDGAIQDEPAPSCGGLARLWDALQHQFVDPTND